MRTLDIEYRQFLLESHKVTHIYYGLREGIIIIKLKLENIIVKHLAWKLDP